MRQLVDVGEATIAGLMLRYGGPVAHVLGDPTCARFSVPCIEGVIAYRPSLRCRVAIGDPVCAPRDQERLAERFRVANAGQGCSTVYAAAGQAFAERCIAHGYAAIEFGQEQIFDPQRDPTRGSSGRELRKKVHRAERDGVTIHEPRERELGETSAQMREVGRAWLAARHGPQAYITPLHRFEPSRGRRFFYALHHGRMVGVLSLVRMDAHDGWVFEHLLPRPDAPVGTSELLVTTALHVLGTEGSAHATFGPAALAHLGRMCRVGAGSSLVGRLVFDSAGRLFHIESQKRFREKFQVARREGSYLLFHPARVGLFEAIGLLRAFGAH
jgi:ergosteryl-3beta-O-L-aspartate synthase